MAPPKRVTEVLDDLLDADQVADLLGLASGDVVRTYASARTDFPAPILPRDLTDPKRSRSTRYWYRPDIVRWRRANPPRRRGSTVTPPP